MICQPKNYFYWGLWPQSHLWKAISLPCCPWREAFLMTAAFVNSEVSFLCLISCAYWQLNEKLDKPYPDCCMNNLKLSGRMLFSFFLVQVPLQSSVDTKSLKKQDWDLWAVSQLDLGSKIKASKQGKCSWYNRLSLLSTRPLPQKAEGSQNFCLVTQKSTGSTGSIRLCLSLAIPGRNTFVLSIEAVREEHHWAHGLGLSPATTKEAAAYGATQRMPWVVHCGSSSFPNTGACLFWSHPTFSVACRD